MVAEALARVAKAGPAASATETRGPEPTQEQIAAAAGMSEGDRTAMIRGMVEGLAARLKDNGDDVPGWLRLARAYMVLGEPDRARAAGEDARRVLAADEARLRQLNDGLKALGL
jgi:cytochrome c-type biogenesis protein CcmH